MPRQFALVSARREWRKRCRFDVVGEDNLALTNAPLNRLQITPNTRYLAAPLDEPARALTATGDRRDDGAIEWFDKARGSHLDCLNDCGRSHQ